MSAFVVQDATINRVISYLSRGRDIEHIQRVIKEEIGADVTNREGCEALGRAMFALNCNAVDQRYSDCPSRSDFHPEEYEFRYEMQVGKIQAYKSLQCWNYQCTEGDVPDTSLLYATMERVAAMLAHAIINDLPEYDRAKWD